jgi:hypothetical protein
LQDWYKNLDCVYRIRERADFDQSKAFDSRWQAGAFWHQRSFESDSGSFAQSLIHAGDWSDITAESNFTNGNKVNWQCGIASGRGDGQAHRQVSPRI